MNWNHHTCEDCQVELRVPAFKCQACQILHLRKQIMITKTKKPRRGVATTPRERKLRKLLTQLADESDAAWAIGHQMANVMYNLSQDTNNKHSDVMRLLYLQWDRLTRHAAIQVAQLETREAK